MDGRTLGWIFCEAKEGCCWLVSTFVDDGHFERYADDSYKVFSGHQRAQDSTNTQSFTFPLVDELKKRSVAMNINR